MAVHTTVPTASSRGKKTTTASLRLPAVGKKQQPRPCGFQLKQINKYIDRISAERVAILSDIHLGRSETNYACNVPGEIIRTLLKRLNQEVDLVVLGGDLFDLDRGTLPLRQEHELKLLWESHFPTIMAMRGPKTRWITGNHDMISADFGLACHAIEVMTQRGCVLIEHGHRFDSWIKQFRVFTQFVTWFSGRIARPKTQKIFDLMQAIERFFIQPSKESDRGKTVKQWLISQPQYEGMIIGHTHLLRHYELPTKQWLIFSGQAMHLPMTYTILDADKGVIELISSTNGVDRVIMASHKW